jgi:hypothetical protein
MKMDVRTALATIAVRAVVSGAAGLLVSAFAAVALSFGAATSADPLAVGRTISGSLSPVLSAIVGAGFFASIVVFSCLVAHDLLRRAIPWMFAQRGLLLGPIRAITWLVRRTVLLTVVALQFVARSAVVVEAVWLVVTAGKLVVTAGKLVVALGKAVGFVLVCVTAVGLTAITYIGTIGAGFISIGVSRDIVVAMLDDPPRPLTMALAIGGAIVLMYIGIAVLTLCGWLAYRVTRAGLRRAAVHRIRTAVS